MLDLDGTVYCGNELIPGADKAIAHMRESGLKVLFCTNNSTKTPKNIASKLENMGIPCTEKDVVSSGMLAVEYVIEHDLHNVYFSGTEEMRTLFVEHGADLCDEKHAENLVLAFDMKFDYAKLTKAVRAALRSKKIVVCNEDRLFPIEDGVYPGSGAVVAPVLYCTGRKADVFLGKPNIYMMNYVSAKYKVNQKEILVIGDTKENDILMAEKNNSSSILITLYPKEKNQIKSLSETTKWNWSEFEE